MIIDITKFELKLKHEFRIARETQVVSKNLFVRININGITGYGEGAPTEYYNEDIDKIIEIAKSLRNIDEPDLDNPNLFFKNMEENYKKYPSLRMAVDSAIYDIIGKYKKVPLYKMFGYERENTPQTSFTIGIDTKDIFHQKLKEAVSFPIIKVKMGSENDFDIIKILKLFPEKKYCIDANEGWEKEEAVKKIEMINEIGVEFIEQPLKKDDLEGILWLKERVDVKIYTDENVRTSYDIDNIKDIYDGINIKLTKCGGIYEALKMIDKAKLYNLDIMFGCMIESSIGITAAAHLSPVANFADLDGNLLINNDPFKGVLVNEGKLVLPKQSGLGINEIKDIF
ncbi:dipeptide epimerase [candidate division KSB1 bacterium]